MISARFLPLCLLVVLAGCGQWPAALPDTYVYSSSSDTWSDVGAYNETRRNQAGALAGTTMFVLGGYAVTVLRRQATEYNRPPVAVFQTVILTC